MNTPASEPCGVHCIRTQHSMKTEQVLICLVSLSDYLFHLPIEGYTHCLHLFFSPDRKSLSFHFPLKPRKFPHVLEPGNPSPPQGRGAPIRFRGVCGTPTSVKPAIILPFKQGFTVGVKAGTTRLLFSFLAVTPSSYERTQRH